MLSLKLIMFLNFCIVSKSELYFKMDRVINKNRVLQNNSH